MSEFEWPCHKRTAHGPHEVWATDFDATDYKCPGVPAHPDTMIGGGHAKEQAVRSDEAGDGSEVQDA